MVVKGYMGNVSSSLHGWSVAVCTIEKANSLINSFIDSQRLDEIGAFLILFLKIISYSGMVVVDEIHMLLDSERGLNLENFLVKLRYFALHTR